MMQVVRATNHRDQKQELIVDAQGQLWIVVKVKYFRECRNPKYDNSVPFGLTFPTCPTKSIKQEPPSLLLLASNSVQQALAFQRGLILLLTNGQVWFWGELSDSFQGNNLKLAPLGPFEPYMVLRTNTELQEFFFHYKFYCFEDLIIKSLTVFEHTLSLLAQDGVCYVFIVDSKTDVLTQKYNQVEQVFCGILYPYISNDRNPKLGLCFQDNNGLCLAFNDEIFNIPQVYRRQATKLSSVKRFDRYLVMLFDNGNLSLSCKKKINSVPIVKFIICGQFLIALDCNGQLWHSTSKGQLEQSNCWFAVADLVGVSEDEFYCVDLNQSVWYARYCYDGPLEETIAIFYSEGWQFTYPTNFVRSNPSLVKKNTPQQSITNFPESIVDQIAQIQTAISKLDANIQSLQLQSTELKSTLQALQAGQNGFADVNPAAQDPRDYLRKITNPFIPSAWSSADESKFLDFIQLPNLHVTLQTQQLFAAVWLGIDISDLMSIGIDLHAALVFLYNVHLLSKGLFLNDSHDTTCKLCSSSILLNDFLQQENISLDSAVALQNNLPAHLLPFLSNVHLATIFSLNVLSAKNAASALQSVLLKYHK